MIRTGVVLAGQMRSIFFYVYISIYIYIYTQCICIYTSIQCGRKPPSTFVNQQNENSNGWWNEARIDLNSWTQFPLPLRQSHAGYPRDFFFISFSWLLWEINGNHPDISRPLEFSCTLRPGFGGINKNAAYMRPRFSSLLVAEFFRSRKKNSVRLLSNRKFISSIKINQNRPSGNLT